MGDHGTAPDEVSKTVEQVLAYQAGDDSVLQDLFQRHYHHVERVVRVKMGLRLRQKESPEDMVAMTFMEAMSGLKRVQLHGSGALVHWLAKVADNVIRGRVDYWDTQKRNPDMEVALEGLSRSASSGAFRIDLAEEAPSPVQRAASREELERFIDCLGELPEDYRQVLILLSVAGASVDYAAEELKRSRKAVTGLYGRAAAKLAMLMKTYDQRRRRR